MKKTNFTRETRLRACALSVLDIVRGVFEAGTLTLLSIADSFSQRMSYSYKNNGKEIEVSRENRDFVCKEIRIYRYEADACGDDWDFPEEEKVKLRLLLGDYVDELEEPGPTSYSVVINGEEKVFPVEPSTQKGLKINKKGLRYLRQVRRRGFKL